MDERRSYLGATDAAAVLGLSPYRAPIDVWLEKRGESDGVQPTQRMRLGQLLEAAIADAYAEETGRTLRRVGTVRHKRYPFLAGHPDRLVVGEPGVFEAKASASTRGYSDDDVPPHVRVQAIWYTGLTNRLWCDVGLLAGMGLRIVRVEHDAALYTDLVDAAVEWWQCHIAGGEEPAPDGTESYRRHLTAKFPLDSGTELVATPEQQLLADELYTATADVKAAEQRKTAIENRLRAAMGDATTLIGPGFRCTWKQQAGRVGWKDVAVDYRRLIEANADHIRVLEDDEHELLDWLGFIESAHTAEPTRVFRSAFTEAETKETAA
jgi:putative phage-type endonuclease